MGRIQAPLSYKIKVFQTFQNITHGNQLFRPTQQGKPYIFKSFFAKYVIFLSD